MVGSCCTIFSNPPWQYNEHQTRADEKGKCLDEGLEPTYYFTKLVSLTMSMLLLEFLQLFVIKDGANFMGHVIKSSTSQHNLGR